MKLSWHKTKEEYCYEDEVVTTYRDFTIALAIPNGGIIGITIWNKDKTIVESVCTEEYDKYCDEEWHLQQGKARINELLTDVNQLSLL